MGAEEPVRRREVVPDREMPDYEPAPATAPVQPSEPQKQPA